MVLPRWSAALYTNTGILLFLLRQAEDLIDGRDAQLGLGPAVLAQRHHPQLVGRVPADLSRGGFPDNQAPHVFVDDEELVDPRAPPVACAAALVAAGALVKVLRLLQRLRNPQRAEGGQI